MKYLTFFSVSLILTQAAFAYDLHIPTGRFVYATKIDHVNQTAVIRDKDHKEIRVSLSEISPETTEAINGIKQGGFAQYNDETGNRLCTIFHVFKNGEAYVGCQTGKGAKIIGLPRPGLAHGFINIKDLLGEVDTLQGFRKGDRARLLSDVNGLECGSKVRIEAVFSNGEALIQKTGFNLLDTSSPLQKYGTVKVNLSDLSK